MNDRATTAFVRKNLSRLGSALKGVTRPELEAVYQEIFVRDLARLNMPDTFYPVGAAANYSFLYFILRATQSLEFKSVLELGAGQTTLLLNALRKAKTLTASVRTIEHDTSWAERVRGLVDHDVQCISLVERRDGPYQYQGYDLQRANLPDTIDLLLIDGPIAWQDGRAYARHGALPLLDLLDSEGFVIVVDDAEREGESALVKRIGDQLSEKAINFRSARISAAKCQIIFASGRLQDAAFF